jgi:RND family efflux transporter MFP subunit
LLAGIVAEKPIHILFDIDEVTALRLRAAHEKKGQGDRPVGVALPTEAGYPRTAKIDFVDNHINPEKATLTVRAVLPNDDGKLLPGLSVRVRVPLGEPMPVLAVPETAILSEAGRNFAFVVGEKDTLQRRAVVLGPRLGKLVVVKEGLGEKDRVVVERVKELRAGVAVEFTPVTIPAPRE